VKKAHLLALDRLAATYYSSTPPLASVSRAPCTWDLFDRPEEGVFNTLLRGALAKKGELETEFSPLKIRNRNGPLEKRITEFEYTPTAKWCQ